MATLAVHPETGTVRPSLDATDPTVDAGIGEHLAITSFNQLDLSDDTPRLVTA